MKVHRAADGSIPEYASVRDSALILSMIGPDLTREAAMRLLYPRTAEEIYVRGDHPDHMRKDLPTEAK